VSIEAHPEKYLFFPRAYERTRKIDKPLSRTAFSPVSMDEGVVKRGRAEWFGRSEIAPLERRRMS
jgi:hypothetical protein